MSVETEESAQAEDVAAENAAADPALGNVLGAGIELAQALRRVATALAALIASEARLLRASVTLVIIGAVALVALSVSLWACAVALIGWALFVATGSIGVALGVLVALHVVLVVGIWFAIKRALRQASFPATRHELRALGGELRAHVERFQHARPPAAPDDAP